MSNMALPALRARIGDWDYYTTTMTFRDLATTVRYAGDLYQANALDDVIQRELTKRGGIICEYLLKQSQRFFGSLIVAVADGEPQFIAAKIIDPTLAYARAEGLGLLVFDGSQKFFALDGQHRLSAIKLAIKSRPELESEQVSVIFVQHRDTKQGKARTRRLFTTLNRYAKAISKMDAITMDEDDCVAVTTRRLVREFPLFQGKRLSMSPQKALRPSDRIVFTNVITIYDATEIVLKSDAWPMTKSFKQKPGSLQVLDEMARVAFAFWEGLSTSISSIRGLREDPDTPFSAEYRSKEGGHLLFRPIGLTIYARAFKKGIGQGLVPKTMHSRLSRVDYTLSSRPWSGVVWHPGQHLMLSKKENEMLATGLLEYLAGLRSDRSLLETQYRALLSVAKVRYAGRLPKPVYSGDAR